MQHSQKWWAQPTVFVVRRVCVTLMVLCLIAQVAQAQFSLDGELRPRAEYRHGFKSLILPEQDAAFFVEQRTRLNFGYKYEGYLMKVAVQDVHVWGSQPQLLSTGDQQNGAGSLLWLHQAWAEALISNKWSLKFGRQEIVLNDSRIFGNVEWAAQARSHDALLLKYSTGRTKMQLGVAYNQDKAQTTGRTASRGSYKAFQYVWLNHAFGENMKASFLFLNNGKEQLRIDDEAAQNGSADSLYYADNYSQTIGVRLTHGKGKVKTMAYGYYQTGLDGNRENVFNDQNGRYDRTIAAFDVALEVAYAFTEKYKVIIGGEYLSGNSQTETGSSYTRVEHAFNPFYGTNHKFNGHMDYFYVGNHIGSVGLRDLYLKLQRKSEKYSAGVDVHHFCAAGEVWDGYRFNRDLIEAQANGTPDDVAAINDRKYTDYVMPVALGIEVDTYFGFALSKGVNLKAGYSTLFATETLAYLKGALNENGQGVVDRNNSWGWLMLQVKPEFLEKKNKE